MWIADQWKDYAVLDCGGGELDGAASSPERIRRPGERLSWSVIRVLVIGNHIDRIESENLDGLIEERTGAPGFGLPRPV